MEFQEMKKLESEVKGLHHLMREVHRNQVELNRVLLSRCTYSRSVRLGELEVAQEKEATKPASEDVEVIKYSPPSPETDEKPTKEKAQNTPSPSSSETKQECEKYDPCETRVKPEFDQHETRTKPEHDPRETRIKPEHDSRETRIKPEHDPRETRIKPEHDPRETRIKPEQDPCETRTKPDHDPRENRVKPEHDLPDISDLPKPPQTVANPSQRVSSQSSSFIRNILSEDSRAGVAIIDLFLTVKMAKDNLQCLSRSNAEAFDKIRQLKTETVAIGRGYRLLLDDMRDLLTRMNESLLNKRILPAVIHLRGKQSYKTKLSDYVVEKTGDEENSRGSQTPMNSQESDIDSMRSDNVVREDADSRGARRKSVGASSNVVKRERQKTDVSESSSSGCLSCFVSSHKDMLFDELPDLSEESLASFLATLFRMQKGEQRVCETCLSSSLFAPSGEDDESDGNLTLSDSSFRMFCNICEILDMAAREDLGSDLDLTEDADKEVSEDRSFRPSFGGQKENRSVSHHTTGTSTSRQAEETLKNCMSCRKKSLRTKSSKREVAVETESEFDDTTAHPLRTLPRPEPKPSVTCMGDLTRAVPGKKNVSTLTTTNNILSYRKLPNDIRSKIKRIRSKKNLKAERQKSGKGCRRSCGKSKTPGGTPSDGLDISVKDSQLHIGLTPKGRSITPVLSALAPDSDSTFTMGCINFRGDDYMSEDSFHNCDSESADAGFSSGEDDLEEFVEIFNENSRTVGKNTTQQNERVIAWNKDSVDVPQSKEFSPSNSFLGFLHKTTLKTIRTLFFEIQKCYPAYFVQEILPKRLVQTSEESLDDGSISLNPGENKQKKVIIKGSSTDFVIYIQVEMDESSRPSSEDFILEQRMSSPLIQSPSLSHSLQMGSGKEDDDDDCQSVGDVWEECDAGRAEELEEVMLDGALITYTDMERISYSHRMQPEGLYVDSRAQRAIKEREPRRMGTAVPFVIKQTKRYADIWLRQNCHQRMFFWVRLTGTEITEEIPVRSAELERALTLIREVENDIAEVKLSDAISILPRLEWELRKHLRSKMKLLGETEQSNDVIDRNLFPNVNFWPEEESPEVGNKDTSERMRNLLMMLTELEHAIKANENVCKNGIPFGKYDSSKVYKLLRALVANIQGLEGDASFSNLSQTLDIASQLDTAVREYDSIVRKRPVDYLSPDSARIMKGNLESVDPVPEKQHLRNVRRKVFQTVEGEALQLEGRVEKDFARLTQLERENDEAMTFLEAFLQKMGRRMSELNSLKTEIKNLSISIRDKQDSLMEKVLQKNKEREEKEVEAQKRAKELKEAEAEAEKRAAQAKEAEAEAQRRAAQVREAEAETKRRAAQLKEAEVEAQKRANQLKEAEAQRRAAQKREAEAEKRAAEAKEAEILRRVAQAKEAEAQKRAVQLKEAEAEAQKRAAQIEAERRATQAREAEAEAQKRAAQIEAEKKAAQLEAEKRAAQVEAHRRAAQAEADRRAALLKEAEAEAQKRATQLKEAESKRRAAQLKEAEAETEKRAAQLKEAEAQKRAALVREAEAKSRAAEMKEAEAEAQRRADLLKDAEGKRWANQTRGTEIQRKGAEHEKKATELKEPEKKASEPKEPEKKAAEVKEPENKAAEPKEAEVPRRVTQMKEAENSKDIRPPSPKEVVLRETVSGLLLALDRLKARAREKNQLCREILASPSDKMRLSGSSSRRASRSSFTAKHTDTLTSSVKTFRKIGPSSLYLAWTKPEGSLKEFVSGYEIYLNGKLNQKVRDAARLQAVLYSVDFTNGVDLEMYAITESHPKTLLLTARFQED